MYVGILAVLGTALSSNYLVLDLFSPNGASLQNIFLNVGEKWEASLLLTVSFTMRIERFAEKV